MAKASEPALQLQEAFYTVEFYLVSGHRLLPKRGTQALKSRWMVEGQLSQSASTSAWLWCSSFALKSSVTTLCPASESRSSAAAGFLSSSAR